MCFKGDKEIYIKKKKKRFTFENRPSRRYLHDYALFVIQRENICRNEQQASTSLTASVQTDGACSVAVAYAGLSIKNDTPHRRDHYLLKR